MGAISPQPPFVADQPRRRLRTAAPFFAVVAASVLFGTTGTVTALAPAGTSVLSLGMVRVVVGGALLGALAWSFAGRARLRGARRAGAARVGSVTRFRFAAVIGALGVVAYQPLFFAGTAANGVAVGTVVALGSAPLLTGVLGWGLSRRAPGRIWWLATALAIVGVALIAQLVSGGTGAGLDPAGIVCSLGAGLSYAVYTLAGKRLTDTGSGFVGAMGTLFGVAAVIAVPIALATDLSWLASSAGVAVAIWLGVATVMAAYLLFGFGLTRLPAPTVATVTLAEPLTATLLGVLVLQEALSPLQLFGMSVLAFSVLLLGVASENPQATPGDTDA